MSGPTSKIPSSLPLPPDGLNRTLAVANADSPTVPQIGMVGNTHSILLSGKDTDGRYCLIDMHIPPGGGPPPHRHDLKEMFSVLEGEIELTFRGEKTTASAGTAVNIPWSGPCARRLQRHGLHQDQSRR